MKKIIYISIFIITSLTIEMFSQGPIRTSRLIKGLKNKNIQKEDQIYVAFNIIDSLERINLFLVNRSNKNINLNGYNQVLEFGKEAKNKDGEWKRIDLDLPETCGTGYGPFILPTNSFTWNTTPKKDLNDGDFETEIRFFCSTTDTILYSESIPAKIDVERFLDPRIRMNNRIDNYILEGVTSEMEKKLLLRKIINYCKLNEYLKSSEVAHELLTDLSQAKSFEIRKI